MTIVETLDSGLESLMAAVRRVERFLGPEDDWVEDDRRMLYEAAQSHLGHLHTFVYEKGPRDYVTTVDASPDEVEEVLMPPYQRNLVSSRKYRTHHGADSPSTTEQGRQWAVGSFVVDGLKGKEYQEQHHVYLFESPNGGTDVYAHRETSVVEGEEHLTETNQQNADPHVLFDLFDRAKLEYGRRNL